MRSITRVAVRASDADVFISGLQGLGVFVEDTGERVTTDEGYDGEIVLEVAFPVGPGSGAGDRPLVSHRSA